MKSPLFLGLLFLITLGCSQPVNISDKIPGQHLQKVNKRHSLFFVTPENWRVKNIPEFNGICELELEDPSNPGFKVLMTISQVGEGKNAIFKTSDEVKGFVYMQAAQLSLTSSEGAVNIIEISSNSNKGYFAKFTDARAKLPSNEFRKVCQGMALIGELRIAITILYQAGNESVVDRVFDLIKQAKDVA